MNEIACDRCGTVDLVSNTAKIRNKNICRNCARAARTFHWCGTANPDEVEERSVGEHIVTKKYWDGRIIHECSKCRAYWWTGKIQRWQMNGRVTPTC